MPLAAGSATIAAQPAQAPVVPARGLAAEYRMDLETRNLFLQSELLSAWSKATGMATPTLHAATPPTGGTAWRLTALVGTNSKTISRTGLARTVGQQVVVSAYAKMDTHRYFALIMTGYGDFPGPPVASFDLLTGASAHDTGCDWATAEPLGDGWYRCSAAFTPTATTSNTMTLALADGLLGSVAFNAAGTESLLVAGPQYEHGTELGSYTPTSNKRAVYDYSGRGNHAHLGSAGTAFINPVGGPKALNLPGTSGNYASTPDAAALDITGDIDLRVRVLPNAWAPGATTQLLTKLSGGGGYGLGVYSTGLPFAHLSDGTTSLLKNAPALPAYVDGEPMWLRWTLDSDNGAGGYTVRFYTSADGSTWDQLGADVVTAGVLALGSNTAALAIGSNVLGTSQNLAGRIYRAQVFDGIDGTLVADFNAEDAPGDVGAFVSSTTGEVWTLNQSAATTNDPAWSGDGLVFDGVDDHVTLPVTPADGVVEVDGALLPLAMAGVDLTTPGGTTGAIRTATLYDAAQTNAEKWQTINTITRHRERGGGSVPTALVRAGLVAEYRFDEGAGTTLTDHSGNGHDGALSGALWTPEGLLFDGVDDNMPDVASFPSTAVTIMYVGAAHTDYTTLALDGRRTIGHPNQLGVSGYLGTALTPGTNRAKWVLKATPPYYADSASIPVDTWFMSGVRVDGQAVRTYNSITPGLIHQTTTLGSTISELTYVALNAPLGGAHMTMAYALFYNRALTDAEVAHNYEALKRTLALRGVALP